MALLSKWFKRKESSLFVKYLVVSILLFFLIVFVNLNKQIDTLIKHSEQASGFLKEMQDK
ncbi:hypothetical protein BBH88_16955 [Planococcus antarcticus DSM 14505]|uniref:Uncharacterized protein n=1 Tax=Planococcus antarcticus DSM 14505 TaxID=1185653 RepID=A0ABN4RII1_9BACL|nr:hypothetical protein BBH88_16955 [Planococcus antarcticus DSM 14505]